MIHTYRCPQSFTSLQSPFRCCNALVLPWLLLRPKTQSFTQGHEILPLKLRPRRFDGCIFVISRRSLSFHEELVADAKVLKEYTVQTLCLAHQKLDLVLSADII